ncbi:MAG: helix-turn-helix transcriptional regulator [Deltaproteobacteria bacterium]|nr:helix-turn-helix transcriptional regulator [Deltaproteobacteria bacterium]
MSLAKQKQLEKDFLAIKGAVHTSDGFGFESSGAGMGRQRSCVVVSFDRDESATPYSLFYVGTGGAWRPGSFDSSATGGRLEPLARAADRKGKRRDVAPSVGELLAQIRSSFGLNVKQTAEALRVERPTVYAWINESSAPNADNEERIRSLGRLSKAWQRLTSVSAGRISTSVLSTGATLLDLLRQEPIPFDEVLEILPEVASRAERTAQIRSGKAGRAREAARRLGLNPDTLERGSEHLDWITGKRGGTE